MRPKIGFWLAAAALFLAGCAGRGTMQTERQELAVEGADTNLAVRVAGSARSGQALIALHGGPGMSSGYLRDLEQLAGPDLAVVTYDQRGAGRSTSPPDDPASYTFEMYVRDLEAVREATRS